MLEHAKKRARFVYYSHPMPDALPFFKHMEKELDHFGDLAVYTTELRVARPYGVTITREGPSSIATLFNLDYLPLGYTKGDQLSTPSSRKGEYVYFYSSQNAYGLREGGVSPTEMLEKVQELRQEHQVRTTWGKSPDRITVENLINRLKDDEDKFR
jgi:hypothetical protein